VDASAGAATPAKTIPIVTRLNILIALTPREVIGAILGLSIYDENIHN
jgi:hypothetical protein